MLGVTVGFVGLIEGQTVGADGTGVGFVVAFTVGAVLGVIVGSEVGGCVGSAVGYSTHSLEPAVDV
jgi:hypothetical protein